MTELLERCPHPSIPLQSGNLFQSLRSRKLVSSPSPKAISADRRTLAETTHLPAIFIMSTMSEDVTDCPSRPEKSLMIDLCSFSSGAGPEATPPKPRIGLPAGLTLE